MELAWLRVQLDALDEPGAMGGTLVVSGLSGPYDGVLREWSRWLGALDEALELEAVWGYRSRDGWGRERGSHDAAVAVSSVAPGVRRLFEVLAGYTWSPRPPSHGQHVLVLSRLAGDGASDVERLIAQLSRHVADGASEPRIEFVEGRGQLEDVRLGRVLSIPEDRSSNLEDFVMRLVFGRLTAVSDEAWDALGTDERLEAFRAHPRIGAQKAQKDGGAKFAGWSASEQAGVADAESQTRARLAELNDAYFEKHSFIFIICASGKSAAQMLSALEERLANDTTEELRNAAAEQATINRLRLAKLVGGQ